MPKKKLPSNEDEFNQRRDILIELLSSESDRGVVMIGASFLDEALEVLLRAKFGADKNKVKDVVNPLFGGVGPLTTFSSKIKLSYALDLIDDWVYKDMEIVREIRNTFAHQISAADFGDADVFNLTERLVGASHAVTSMSDEQGILPTNLTDIDSQKHKENKHPKDIGKEKQLTEKMRFILTVSYISGLLYGTTSSLQKSA